MTDSKDLHLPDLSIKGFRGIEALLIPTLGRVTLLAGKNSVGKTTVLDAVAVYASRGRSLSSLLWDREEVPATIDEDGDSVLRPDWGALFHGRNISQDARLSIGPNDDADLLTIELGIPGEQQARLHGFPVDAPLQVLKATYRDTTQILTWTDYSQRVSYSHPSSNNQETGQTTRHAPADWRRRTATSDKVRISRTRAIEQHRLGATLGWRCVDGRRRAGSRCSATGIRQWHRRRCGSW